MENTTRDKLSHTGNSYLMTLDNAIEEAEQELHALKIAREAASRQINHKYQPSPKVAEDGGAPKSLSPYAPPPAEPKRSPLRRVLDTIDAEEKLSGSSA